jgi:hypothetical protein
MVVPRSTIFARHSGVLRGDPNNFLQHGLDAHRSHRLNICSVAVVEYQLGGRPPQRTPYNRGMIVARNPEEEEEILAEIEATSGPDSGRTIDPEEPFQPRIGP